MELRRVLLSFALVGCIIGAGLSVFLMYSADSEKSVNAMEMWVDPLIQDEGHDHRNASQHKLFTENIQPISFNALTAPGIIVENTLLCKIS